MLMRKGMEGFTSHGAGAFERRTKYYTQRRQCTKAVHFNPNGANRRAVPTEPGGAMT